MSSLKIISPNFAVLEVPNSASLSFILTVRDGVAYESFPEWGCAHFLEHLQLENVPGYKSVHHLASALEARGGKLSAWTGKYATSYWFKIPHENWEAGFKLLKQVLSHNHFPQARLEAEKQVVGIEIVREAQNYRTYNAKYLEEMLLFPAACSRSPLGSLKSLANLTAEMLMQHKARFYNSKNIYMALAGPVSDAMITGALDVASVFPGGSEAKEAPDLPPVKLPKSAFLSAPHLNLYYLALGWAMPYTGAEVYAWQLLHYILGVGYGSLLFKALREDKPMVYSVNSALRLYANLLSLALYFEVEEKNLPKAYTAVTKVLSKLKSQGIGQKPLERAKQLLWSTKVFNREDTLEAARELSTALVMNREADLEKVKSEIFSVTAEQLHDMVKKLRLSELKTSLAGKHLIQL